MKLHNGPEGRVCMNSSADVALRRAGWRTIIACQRLLKFTAEGVVPMGHLLKFEGQVAHCINGKALNFLPA